MVQAYCVKCKSKKEMKDPKNITMKSFRKVGKPKIFDFVEKFRSLVVIITTAEGLSLAVKEGANAKKETVRRIYAEIIDEGIDQGFFRPFDSLLAARMILAALSGLVETIIANNNETIDLEKNVSECMKLFLSGLSEK